MRRAALIGFAVLTACSFNDPNAPPPPDPCIEGPATAMDFKAYWARIDGPAPCAVTTDPDTISHFTGSAWNEPSALCRAKDLFLGATPVVNAETLTLLRDLPVPANAFGYCIVNKGTPSEVVSYSVCGQAEAGKGACEQTLPQQASIEVTAEWVGCPGGPLCPQPDPTEKDDACAGIGESDVNNSYSVWVDVPHLFCVAPAGGGDADADAGAAPEEPEPTLEDQRDSLFVTLGSAYNRQASLCTASSVYDLPGNLQFNVEAPLRQPAATRDENGVRTGIPTFDPSKVTPEGAKGYCHFGDEKSGREAVLYSFCDIVVGQDDAAAFSPKAMCEAGYPRATKRPGKWVACPGGPLCVD